MEVAHDQFVCSSGILRIARGWISVPRYNRICFKTLLLSQWILVNVLRQSALKINPSKVNCGRSIDDIDE